MTPKPTNLAGVWKFEPKTYPDYYDPRGLTVQTWNESNYNRYGTGLYPIDWVQENLIVSNKRALRGIHGYRDIWRLCYCAHGDIYFVVVDCKEGTPQFGEWQAWRLYSPQDGIILVPPGFGMACLTLSQTSIFIYKWSEYYEQHEQFRFKWNDERFKIKWPIADPILSEEDR